MLKGCTAVIPAGIEVKWEPLALLCFAIKELLHRGENALERKRLLQNGGVLGKFELAVDLFRVAGHENHLHIRILFY